MRGRAVFSRVVLTLLVGALAGCGFETRAPDASNPTVVPNIVKMTWDKGYPKLQAARLSSQLSSSLGLVTTPDHILVTSTNPKAGASVPSWSTVLVSVALTQVVPAGLAELDIVNQNQDQRPISVYLADGSAAYQKKGDIPLNGSLAITFQTGHSYAISVVDRGLINCPSEDPANVSCQRGFVLLTGASNGPKQTWNLS